MENFFTTLGYGLLALLGVATAVAFWEQWRSRHLGGMLLPGAEQSPAGGRRVDVDVSALEPATAAGDQAQRQLTVDGALQRMARSLVTPGEPAAWIETRPMVAPGEVVQGEAH